MGFFGWFLLFLLLSYIVLRIFRRQIFGAVIRKMSHVAKEQMERQNQAFREAYSRDPYHDDVHVSPDVHVKIPKQKSEADSPISDYDKVAEDVDFIEVDEADDESKK